MSNNTTASLFELLKRRDKQIKVLVNMLVGFIESHEARDAYVERVKEYLLYDTNLALDYMDDLDSAAEGEG